MWVLLSSRPPPVICQVEIGKVVEKDDSLQQHHLLSLPELPCLYCVQVETSTHWLTGTIGSIPLH